MRQVSYVTYDHFVRLFQRMCIFKPTTGNETWYEESNDSGVTVANFTTSKYLTIKIKIFPHRNIRKIHLDVSS
jgi:hypothetical protein